MTRLDSKVVIGNATLYLGDCLEILPTLEKVDAVITDPPYGIEWECRVSKFAPIKNDDRPFDPAPFLLLGKWHLFWGANHFASRLPDESRWLIWAKHDPGLWTKRDHAPVDLAWTDFGGSIRALKHIWDGWIKQGEAFNTKHVHPAEKPIELMEWCLTFIPDAKLILDPYMGSGTTGVACKRMDRDFIGIEIEPEYFDIACKRIENAQRQARMFA